MKADTLVVGAGTAGLVAALRLAQAGQKVLVVAAGEGCLPLASGTIDVLGYAPGPVRSPLEALPGFLDANPEHPYRMAGTAGVARSLGWFEKAAEPLGYRGDAATNRWVPTVLGGLRPTGLLPATMRAAGLGGDGGAAGPGGHGGAPGPRGGPEVLVAGIRGFRDFHAGLLAENLSLAAPPGGGSIKARSVELDWPGSPGDLVPFRLARRLEDTEVRRHLAAQLRPRLGGAAAVAMPAVLGRDGAAEVLADLERRLERPVFEVPGLPPSLPGLRLFDCLRAALRRAGGRLLLGSTAVSAVCRDGRVVSVTITQAARPAEVTAGDYVLATGGFATGGIVREFGGELREPVFGLPVAQPGSDREPFGDEYLAEHPMDRAGLRTDPDGRPLGAGGEPFAANLHAAGAVLAGAVPWREKSGEGLSLTTGLHAAEAILRSRGAAPAEVAA